jgi:hypothetical protein
MSRLAKAPISVVRIILPSIFPRIAENKSRAETEGKGASSMAISAVLDNDDLLYEILLRLAFPTSLVRASLVCKRWLALASAPAFLRRFRDLHPPSLLGFYVQTEGTYPPKFVPLPQPPELAAVISHASFDLDSLSRDKFDYVLCCNGLLILPDRPLLKTRVSSPLYPARYTAVLPTVRDTSIHGNSLRYHEREILTKAGAGGDDLSYFCLAMGYKEQHTVMDVYELQDGVWAIHSSAVTELPEIGLQMPCSLLADTKIYNSSFVNDRDKLVVLDLVSSSFSLLNFPEEMEPLGYQLSLTYDSHLHLIHVKGSQLHIWLHQMDDNGLSNWFLENTICLHEICANSMIPNCILEDVKVEAVAGNSRFVFMEMEGIVYMFDIKRKTAKKVYEITPEDKSLVCVIPFMMGWPPKFPVMMERCDPK